MNCAEFDWKAYVLGELSPGQVDLHKQHWGACPVCRVEVDQLSLTMAALNRLPQAEPPRRISFVSDPVTSLPWWKGMWQSGPQLGFASAALLSVAILAHGMINRVPPSVATPSAPVAVSLSPELEGRVQAEVEKRLAVALAEAQKRNEESLARLAGIEKRLDDQRRQDLKEVRESFGYLERQIGQVYRNASQVGGD